MKKVLLAAFAFSLLSGAALANPAEFSVTGKSSSCFVEASAIDLAQTNARNKAYERCSDRGMRLERDSFFWHGNQCRQNCNNRNEVRCETRLTFYCK